MRDEPDRTRRQLINIGGAALLSNALSVPTVRCPDHPWSRDRPRLRRGPDHGRNSVLAGDTTLANYIAGARPRTACRGRCQDQAACSRHGCGDGVRLAPQARRIGSTLCRQPRRQTAGDGDRHVDRDFLGPCGAGERHGRAWRRDRRLPISPAVSIRAAALCRRRWRRRNSPTATAATCCARWRSATTLARGSSSRLASVALYIERHSTHSLSPPSAPRRRRPRCCGSIRARCAMRFSFAAQQASGVPYWERDREHIEKAFDFGGMGARNGVTAATMIASGFTGGRGPLLGRRQRVHRARRQARAGKTRRRARHPLRNPQHLDQEMVRRLAAPIGARRRNRAARGPGRARRQDQAYHGRHAGRPPAHRRQPDHSRYLSPAPRGADDCGQWRHLRQRSRFRTHARSQGARDPQACRSGAEPGAGQGGAGAPVDRQDRDGRWPHAQSSHLRGPRHARQSDGRERGRRQGARPDGADPRHGARQELIAAIYKLDSFGPVSGLRRCCRLEARPVRAATWPLYFRPTRSIRAAMPTCPAPSRVMLSCSWMSIRAIPKTPLPGDRGCKGYRPARDRRSCN